MLSPVEQSEFLLFGVVEHGKVMRDMFFSGVWAGACLGVLAAGICLLIGALIHCRGGACQ